jgi:hypothetical protein
MPSIPRSQKLWTLVRRSANTVALESVRLSNTLIKPLFSATKTRPSLANSIAVGLVSPEKTIRSTNCGVAVVNDHVLGAASGLPSRSVAAVRLAVWTVAPARSADGVKVAVSVAAS